MKEKLHIKILENEIVKLRQTKKEDFDELFKLASKKEIWEQHSDKDRYKKRVTPIIINNKPIVVARFGICLYLKIPIKDKAIIPTPDHVA